jgi:hypothetical protein
VALSYVVTAQSDNIAGIVNRLNVDGSEDIHFRSISANAIYHTNSVSGFVYLSAGKHVIKVEYRTSSSFTNIALLDWNIASLQVNY